MKTNPLWARRISAAIALTTIAGAVATVGDETNARAADRTVNCKLANCGDAAWVTACTAATTCAQVPPYNANLGDRVPSMLPQSLGGKAVPSIHRMPPQVRFQKKPRVLIGGAKINTPTSPPVPTSGWQTATGAPPIAQMDRRRLAARAALSSSDAMQNFGVTLTGMQTQQALEDQKAAQRAREDAAIVSRRPQWVGDPTKENYRAPTSHSPVTSCDEYAYKKHFEAAWFRDAALALGSDYRGVWNIATRSDSPVRLTRALASYGGSAITPGWTEDMLAGSAYNIFSEQIPTPPPTAHGWALAMQLEQAHRNITDGELEDIERRAQRYSDMLTQRYNATLRMVSLMCKKKGGDISWDGTNLDEIVCTVNGAGGTKGGSDGNDGGSTDGKGNKINRSKSPDASFDARKVARPILTAALRTHPALRVASPQTTAELRASQMPLLTASTNALDRLAATLGAPPFAAARRVVVTPTISGGGANVPGSAGRNPVDMSGCKAGDPMIDVQICYARAQLGAIKADLAEAVAFEKNLGASGCLNPDPIANHCNWSYKWFAERMTMMFDWAPVARECSARIGDFSVLTDKTKQTNLANARTIFVGDVGQDYTSDWTKLERWYTALNNAPASWALYDQKRKQYLGKVAGVMRGADALPRTSTGYGKTSGDGFDVGNPDTFGGGAHYGFSWSLTPMDLGKPFYSSDQSCSGVDNKPVPCGVEKRICRFNGAINATADAKASLFGIDIGILDAKVTAYAEDNAKHAGNGAHLDAHFTLIGNELFTQEVKNGINQPASPAFHIARPVADVSASYPDPPIEMGFMVGPIPVTLEAGMSVGAGIDLSADGEVADTCASPAGTQPRFSLVAALSPHVQADAFGQAGVDLAVVEAGVRIDLNLVRVGLPVAFGIKVDGATTTFDAKADLTLSALSGSVGLFAEVHYLVGSDDYELPIFSWNGISSSRSLFDESSSFPTDALSYLMHAPEPWRSPL